MNLSKKKNLAARTLKAGRERIVFVESRLDEIKEAITRQDIKDLHKEGAILIKEIKGRKKIKKKRRRKGPGSISKKMKKRKQEYVKITRKLRKYIAELKKKGKLSKDNIFELRKEIRNRKFSSLKSLKESVKAIWGEK